MGVPAYPIARFDDMVPIDAFVVSPNAHLRRELSERLSLPRWRVVEAASGAEALERLDEFGLGHGVLLLDPMLPDLEPIEFDGMVRNKFPNLQVLTLNSHTGQLMVGRQSPTPLSSKLVEILNNGGPVQSTAFADAPIQTARDVSRGGNRLRGMIGES